MFGLRAGFTMRKSVVASRFARLGFACISADIPLIFATLIKTVVVASSVVLFTAGTASSQICDSIILRGLRNVSVSQSNDSSVALEYFNQCEINTKPYTDPRLAAAEVEIFASGSRGANYSRPQREERVNNWCQTNKDVANPGGRGAGVAAAIGLADRAHRVRSLG